MHNIIVTGGAGYIGSHACKALKAAGYTPITIDNLITGWRDAVKFGPFEQVDLCDRDQLDPIFETYKPAAVMHFAALSQVGESMKEPEKYWRNNVLGSLNLIEACVKHDVKILYFHLHAPPTAIRIMWCLMKIRSSCLSIHMGHLKRLSKKFSGIWNRPMA